MAITFTEFCKKYQGEKNSQGIYYTTPTIQAETGMDLGTLEKWTKFYMDTLYDISRKENRWATDDEIIAAWELANKPVVNVGTLPGTSMHEQGLSVGGKDLVIRMTRNDLWAGITEIVDDLLTTHLGK